MLLTIFLLFEHFSKHVDRKISECPPVLFILPGDKYRNQFPSFYYPHETIVSYTIIILIYENTTVTYMTPGPMTTKYVVIGVLEQSTGFPCLGYTLLNLRKM